jgi:hypothetical protein
MSNAFAIAGVTAVLQYYFYNLYQGNSDFQPPVSVSCLAPDIIQNQVVNGFSGTESQVNLFLYQVTHNAAWRNVEQASLAPDGVTRLSNPPLALDLHYLLTVYGSESWEAEALLGYALMMLHEAPILSRADIANAMENLSLVSQNSTLLSDVVGSGLANQVEMIKITPESMTKEELAWLWTALKADYRPTYPFQVSVVLMKPQQQASFALPVLSRNVNVVPVQPSQLLALKTPLQQGAAQPGDPIIVIGEFLRGASLVVLTNARTGEPITPAFAVASATQSQFTITLPPAASADYLAGLYSLAVQFLDSDKVVQQTTNTLPIALVPTLPATQNTSATATAAGVLVSISGIAPPVGPGQTATMTLIGQPPATPMAVTGNVQAFTGSPTTTLDFLFNPDQAPPTGTPLLARLQVDGASSLITVSTSSSPPFTGPLVTLS